MVIKRTEPLYLRVDESVVQRLRLIADLNERSMASTANQLLRKALELDYVPLLREDNESGAPNVD